MKKYNVLILDDIGLVGSNIYQRICKADEFYSSLSGIKIIPHYEELKITKKEDIQVSADKIGQSIQSNKIDYLLIDRGLFKGVSVKNEYLYAEKKKWLTTEKILQNISKETYQRIKGIIIYTYDTTIADTLTEPAAIRIEYLKFLPEKFKEDDIKLLVSKTEIYDLAELTLYADEKENIKGTILYKLGLKSDFMLYGLFMGEILYHKIISMINQKRKAKFIAKRNLIIRNIVFLFFVFTGLSLGGNSLYNFLVSGTNNANSLLLFGLSIVFSVVMPLLLLLIKPELVLPIDTDNGNDKKD